MLQILETIEAQAWQELMAAAPADFLQAVGGEYRTFAGAFLMRMSAIPMQMVNRCFQFPEFPSISVSMVAEVMDYFRSKQAPQGIVQLPPALVSTDLNAQLAPLGIQPSGTWAKMFVKKGEDLAFDHTLTIKKVDASLAATFVEITLKAQGMPPLFAPWIPACIGRSGWTHYLAFEGALPIASGALFVKDGVGWLGMGGTLPEFRRRGAQRALMSQRIRDAWALGCNLATTETGEREGQPNPSLSNMYRCGFQKAYSRINYARKP